MKNYDRLFSSPWTTIYYSNKQVVLALESKQTLPEKLNPDHNFHHFAIQVQSIRIVSINLQMPTLLTPKIIIVLFSLYRQMIITVLFLYWQKVRTVHIMTKWQKYLSSFLTLEHIFFFYIQQCFSFPHEGSLCSSGQCSTFRTALILKWDIMAVSPNHHPLVLQVFCF